MPGQIDILNNAIPDLCQARDFLNNAKTEILGDLFTTMQCQGFYTNWKR